MIEDFLKELSELSKKYKMYIGGCGCCDSPYIDDENGKEVAARLTWDYQNERYTRED